MPITLRRLCKNAESSYNMKLVAGRGGLDCAVRWVHMVEDSGVPDLLHGSELIFTTGIGYSGSDWLQPFVQELKEHDAAGLVVNLGPHIDSIPPKVVVYCEEQDFPLFTLPWEIHLIDITYEFCRRIIANEEQETSLANAFRGMIFDGEKREYIETLKQSGFDENSDYTLIAVSSESGIKTSSALKNSSALRKILRRSKYHAAAFYQGGCAITVRQSTADEELKRMIAELNALDESDFLVGISEKLEGFGSLSDCYRQCISALSAGKISGRRVTLYSDIGIYKLIFGVEDRSVLRDYADKMLGALIQLDDTTDSDHVLTLKTYLESNGSVLQTAERLGVHRNTVNYKLRSIREILGISLNDEDRMNLLLAFHVLDVLNLK